jgi:hypothetical protein
MKISNFDYHTIEFIMNWRLEIILNLEIKIGINNLLYETKIVPKYQNILNSEGIFYNKI